MTRRFLAAVSAVAAIFTLSSLADAEPLVKEGDLIAVCGDSITEQKDYSVNIGTYLIACQPIKNVSAVGIGWSGDSTGWFWARNFDTDILSFHPTIVTTCYGMNDGAYKAVDPKILATYHDGVTRIVQSLKAGGVRVTIVGSPGAVDNDAYKNRATDAAVYNNTLDALRGEAQKIATEQNVLFADVHTPMMTAMQAAKAKLGPAYHVAGPDGVHPAHNGHLIMAYAYLKSLGFDGDVGTITLDLKSGAVAGSPGHEVASNKSGVLEVRSTRYPFCFTGAPDSPDGTRSILPFIPFNQDLNRYTLKVTGATTPNLKVIWGAQTKEFTAAQLAAGINLAAEFLDNPFSAPFAKVRDAVRQQQDFETMVVKGYRAGVTSQSKDLLEADPSIQPAIDQLTAAMMKRRQNLVTAASAAVVPVTHTITIVPVP